MTQQSGIIAILGEANAGKSTLMNALVGERVAIATPKPHTTRLNVRGVVHHHAQEAIFIDTPGFARGETPIRKVMRRHIGEALEAADVLLGLFPARPRFALRETERDVLSVLANTRKPTLAVVTKVDRLRDKSTLFPMLEALSQAAPFRALIPVSALKKDGLEVLMNTLGAYLPRGPWAFERDDYTDASERFLCEELIREQVLLQTDQEVPHGVAVEVETFLDERGGAEPAQINPDSDEPAMPPAVRIEATVWVEREGHKGILVGRGGVRIKGVGMAARQRMAELLGCPVHLRLRVAVDEGWTRTAARIKRRGLGGDP